MNLRFKVSTLGETAGHIDASGPPTVQAGKYLLQINKNTTTPYDADLSAEFTIKRGYGPGDDLPLIHPSSMERRSAIATPS